MYVVPVNLVCRVSWKCGDNKLTVSCYIYYLEFDVFEIRQRVLSRVQKHWVVYWPPRQRPMERLVLKGVEQNPPLVFSLWDGWIRPKREKVMHVWIRPREIINHVVGHVSFLFCIFFAQWSTSCIAGRQNNFDFPMILIMRQNLDMQVLVFRLRHKTGSRVRWSNQHPCGHQPMGHPPSGS